MDCYICKAPTRLEAHIRTCPKCGSVYVPYAKGLFKIQLRDDQLEALRRHADETEAAIQVVKAIS